MSTYYDEGLRARRQPTRRARRHLWLLGTLALLLALGITGWAWCGAPGAARTVAGSGVLRTEARAVGPFDRIDLLGMGTVRVSSGAKAGLRVQAEANLLPYITAKVQAGQLRLEVGRQGVSLHPSRPITFDVTVATLHGVHLSGTGDIRLAPVSTDTLALALSGSGHIIAEQLTARALQVDLSGTGDIVAAGSASSQDVRIAGAGSYTAADLRSSQARITIAGVGKAVLRVRQTLDASIAGTGSIDYIGSPQVRQRIDGVGSIRQAQP
jgi:hypothetical protein